MTHPYDPIPHVIEGLLRVLNGEGAKKHGDEWKTRDERYEMSHALMHELRAADPERCQHDETGELHELKAFCNRALRLERIMIAAVKDGNGD